MNIASKELFTTKQGQLVTFEEYITRTREYIQKERVDLTTDNAAIILNANSPYELSPFGTIADPKNVQHYPVGALLIHGLLDSPFSLLDIGVRLQAEGIISRTVLLPGHGTRPEGLINATYEQWIETVRYGIATLAPLVDRLYLVGYSTGAALAIHQALKKEFNISGLILLSPAIEIKAPVSIVVAWHRLLNFFSRNATPWLYREKEIDYAKYRSITFNAVKQVIYLTKLISQLSRQIFLDTPLFIIASREDDTISCVKAIKFFSQLSHPESQLLLYCKLVQTFKDSRVLVRPTHYPDLNISQFSHVSIPFSPQNSHYGQNGDFILASRSDNTIYGAYNRIESRAGDFLYRLGLLKTMHHELTYNPDFDFMIEKIIHFIKKESTQ